MTQLQVALDSDLDTALALLEQVHAYVDIVEIGTPLIFREGVGAVQMVRERYPDLTILADLKIMDAGEEEATIAFEAGADYVTVLGVTNDNTIKGAVTSAQHHGGKVMVDMMQVQHALERAQQLLQMGCDVLCVHTAYDLQASQASPYRELAHLRDHLASAGLAIAGGVNLARLDAILPYHPQIVVVGGAITRADNPAQQAQLIKERIQQDAD